MTKPKPPKVLLIEHALIYLEAVLEKSRLFKETIAPMLVKYGIEPRDGTKSTESEYRKSRLKIPVASVRLLKDTDFIKCLERFRIPKWFWKRAALHIAESYETNCLYNKIQIRGPFSLMHKQMNETVPVPHAILMVPISAKKEDFHEAWKVFQKRRKESGLWSKQGNHWKDGMTFDRAFRYYELHKKFKYSFSDTLELMNTEIRGEDVILQELALEANRMGDLEKSAAEIEAQIVSLQNLNLLENNFSELS